ncbi:diguanylate cyclase domain-containing protein [Candidatus Manganitrophus noduliformans]|uniref:Diguanylate cyclase n=1 Tax=Candidatus Manganitrophus noduliformans TaxID=2606439 RepID=A0A7X6DP76_9BACT|nr:diguanylate cyclase [Candidatus Manganitrophus noduliformans]NKE70846.1 diguanylate cyclase [Candidatus Manganitrophus noduliformans]
MKKHSKRERLLKEVDLIEESSVQAGQKGIEPIWRDEKEGKILSSVVEQTADSVVITDPAGRIEYVNPAFEKQTGFSKQEAVGKTPRLVKSGKQDAAFYKQLWDTIRAGRVFRGVLINRRRDGSIYYEEKTITPLINAEGAIVRYVSTGKDITPRMRLEEERMRLVATLEETTDLVAITNADGEIVYLNKTGRTLLGLQSDGPLPVIKLSDVVPEWTRTLLIGEAIPSAIRHGSWSGETALIDRSGREVPVSQVILAHRTSGGEVEFLSTIARDISDRKMQTANLEYLATHDPLTNLPNRTLFLDRLNHTLLAAQREKGSFGLLIIDLDRFKEINDSLGHPVGDAVLQEVGVRLKRALRDSDTVARIGGDEFAVILPNVNREGGPAAIRKIRTALEEPFVLDGGSLFVYASVGMVLFPEHGKEALTLIRRADEAMYRAKQSGSGYEIDSSLQKK